MRGKLTRQNAALPKARALEILRSADYGVLATVNALGQPSVIALNHVLLNDCTLVFHGNKSGEKIENIRGNPQVSFFVLGEAAVIPAEFETTYTAAVVHGKAEIVEDEDEIKRCLEAFVARFVGDSVSREIRSQRVADGLTVTAIIKVTIEHLTGKARPAPVITA